MLFAVLVSQTQGLGGPKDVQSTSLLRLVFLVVSSILAVWCGYHKGNAFSSSLDVLLLGLLMAFFSYEFLGLYLCTKYTDSPYLTF